MSIFDDFSGLGCQPVSDFSFVMSAMTCKAMKIDFYKGIPMGLCYSEESQPAVVRPGKAGNKSAASAASLDGFSSRDQVGC